MIRVWVCQVRREALVGGESQRCRHTKKCEKCQGSGVKGTYTTVDSATGEHLGDQDILCAICNGTGQVSECGEMGLIGGEPVEWCVVHGAEQAGVSGGGCWQAEFETDDPEFCRFESQVRVPT